MTPPSPEVSSTTFPPHALHSFCVAVFEHLGVPRADARLAADVLQQADLRGIDSHGVARLRTYVDMLETGRINPTPTLTTVRETASTATVDGDNGLGLVVGPRANEIAMSKAESAGTGWVSVNHTNHYGIAGFYVLEALKRDLIGWSMTNTTKIVTPHRGAERMLGTNPIAIAFPGHEEPALVIDMATCSAAYGKVEMAQRQGVPIPDGWAIDAAGHSTTDPQDMIDGGAILPLGSDEERSGHKGYCMSIMVDVLSGVLAGANWGPWTPPFTLAMDPPERSVGKGIGHFFGAMQIEAFVDPEEFKRQIDDYVRTFRGTRPAPGTDGPILPGDPEREAEAVRTKEGIPVVDAVLDDLRVIAERTGVDPPG